MDKNTVIFGLALLLALSLQACSVDQSADVKLVKLGAAVKEFTLEPDGGIVNIPVYSNGSYHLEMLTQDNSWLNVHLPSNTGKNGYIHAECSFNPSFKRQVRFALCSDTDARRDTVSIRQKGMKEAVITLNELSLQARGAGGDSSYVITTNVPFDQLQTTISYPAGSPSEWIKSVSIEDTESSHRQMTINTAENPDEDNPRTATVRLRFTDGWGESVTLSFNVIQRTALERIGTTVSMQELKYEHVVSGKPLDKYLIIEGIVVSDKAGRNAGENEQQTTSAIDYSGDQRTIYLESFDGTQGICLMTETIDDNVVSRYDHLQVLLYHAVPVLHSDPEYLVVSGIKSGMIVGQAKGQASDVPVKTKSIRDLSDDDIFTYVKLQQVEIPVRKGSLMPVNEGYTIASNAHRFSKYPRLLRDINGDWIYMLTNTVCQFRNDGTRLPYGSGSISGVLVHERFPRFEWRNAADPAEMDEDPTLGRIGDYQIRPQAKEDIWGGMQDDFEDGFSALLAEYRYWVPDKNAGVCRPSYGNNGWFTHTYQKKYTGSEVKDYTEDAFNQHMFSGGSFDYIGPIGNNKSAMFGLHYGNLNGLGIIIDPEKEHYSPDLSDLVDTQGERPQWCGPNAPSEFCFYGDGENTSNLNYNGTTSLRGKGHVPSECYTSFASNYWWDYDTGKTYAWLLNFSTKGISASGLSMQISTLNTSQTFFSPRYWRAEWSTTDNQEDSNWHLLADYTVPDVSVWSNTLYSSSVGDKHINFALPSEMLGKDNVYIRFRPTSDLCSSGVDYADSRMSEAEKDTHTNRITYIAIRYNK